MIRIYLFKKIIVDSVLKNNNTEHRKPVFLHVLHCMVEKKFWRFPTSFFNQSCFKNINVMYIEAPLSSVLKNKYFESFKNS